mmetsp:Transcript_23877/g.60056  ORF Transcript_23877/g.60056 Transcript_23877/m.60056 type:complete len:331 (+) Transcript_23877:542-1534(+)
MAAPSEPAMTASVAYVEMRSAGMKYSRRSLAPRNMRMPPVAVCSAGMSDTAVATTWYQARSEMTASMVAAHTSGMLVLQLNTAATLSHEKTMSVNSITSRTTNSGVAFRGPSALVKNRSPSYSDVTGIQRRANRDILFASAVSPSPPSPLSGSSMETPDCRMMAAKMSDTHRMLCTDTPPVAIMAMRSTAALAMPQVSTRPRYRIGTLKRWKMRNITNRLSADSDCSTRYTFTNSPRACGPYTAPMTAPTATASPSAKPTWRHAPGSSPSEAVPAVAVPAGEASTPPPSLPARAAGTPSAPSASSRARAAAQVGAAGLLGPARRRPRKSC